MNDEARESVTRHWQESVDLPESDPATDVAIRLVLLSHYGADFTIWGSRRKRYWDALTERVKASTYAGPELAHWWEAMSRSLPCAPRNKAEREDLVHLLAFAPARAVLSVLREQPDVVVLHVRVIADARREQRPRPSATEDDVDQPDEDDSNHAHKEDANGE